MNTQWTATDCGAAMTLPVRIPDVDHVVPIESVRRSRASVPRYLNRKSRFVRPIAALLLVLAAPVIVLACMLVRLTSRGAAIYRQRRVGAWGKEFTMYKIRSMRHDAEAATGAVWATRGDRRVTRLGRFLRRTHVDELPQLWNVVRGEMCLIGPRPERPEIVARLVAEIPDFTDRLVVRPGITGLAQVQLSPDVDLDSVQRKLIVDCWYIHNAGWRLDLKIAVCTFLQLLHVPVAMSHRLCRINRIVNQLSHVPLDSPSATPHRRAA